MNIQPNTKLFDVLEAYPHLEEKIMSLAPPFKNLKNPVLRKTVGKLATLEKAARIGEIDVTEFVNTLRREIGEPEMSNVQEEPSITWQKGEPEWIKGQPFDIIDGIVMLSQGEHPLGKINQLMQSADAGQFVLLKTNFQPIPLIEEMQKQNYEVFHKIDPQNQEQHFTFIKK
ncbi:MAG: DUF1858 domain-containing protein [Caldithrix sp.]|nr:DUF1858 domain-containing protein [Caldithrix sp.]